MLCQLRWNSATMHTSVGIFFHENRGHSHFYFGSFPLLSIPIPNLEFNFHSRGIPTVFPFPSGIPFPWSSLPCNVNVSAIATVIPTGNYNYESASIASYTCGLLHASHVPWSLCVGHTGEPCRTAKPIEMLFWMQTRASPRNRVLDGVHIGTTWRIRLIDP